MFTPTRVLCSSSFVVVAALHAGCNAVSVSGSMGSGEGIRPPPITNPYTPNASDAGQPEAMALPDTTSGIAPPFQGSPLCNASLVTGCCYPDNPTNPQACAQAVCSPGPDAGASDSAGAFAAVTLGCHVYPTGGAPNAATAAGALSGAPNVAPGCLPAGLGVDGVLCSGPSSCASSYECVGGSGGFPGTCQHYCCQGTAACTDGQFCDIQPTTAEPATNVPVCMPIDPCPLLVSGACGPYNSRTCAVVRDDGRTSCVAIGNAKAGESCDTEHCAMNLVCLGSPGQRTCFALCHTKNPQCPAPQKCQGGPPFFPEPDVGICQ
jgi:hypothetical protein